MLNQVYTYLDNGYNFHNYIKVEIKGKLYYCDTICLYNDKGVYKSLKLERRNKNIRLCRGVKRFKKCFFNTPLENSFNLNDEIKRKVKLNLKSNSHFIIKDPSMYNRNNTYILYIYLPSLKRIGRSNDETYLYNVYNVYGNNLFVEIRQINKQIEELIKKTYNQLDILKRGVQEYNLENININDLKKEIKIIHNFKYELKQLKQKRINKKLYNTVKFPK